MKEPSLRAFVVLASLAAAAGCVPLTARSSAAVLGPRGSSAVVRLAQADAADEVVKLLDLRGYSVIDHRQDGPVIALRIGGLREPIEDGANMREVGSIYYVFVAPNAEGRSAITVVGRPTLDGDELCTKDLRVEAACLERYGARDLEQDLDGRAEAQLVRELFSDLRKRGVVDDAARPSHRLAYEREACEARRKQARDRALEHRDPRARAVAQARVDTAHPPCR